MSLKRRFVQEVQDSALKGFLFMTDPKRWQEMYARPERNVEEDGVPMTDADLPDIEKFLQTLGDPRAISGGSLAVSAQGPEDGWQ